MKYVINWAIYFAAIAAIWPLSTGRFFVAMACIVLYGLSENYLGYSKE